MKAQNLRNLTGILFFVGLLITAPHAVAGTIKCWTNKDGIRECGYSVPPEYSQQRIEIMNERGIQIGVKEAAKTKEQLEEDARLAKLKQEELQRQEEARLRDTILLNTFTTERDLKISYDDKIEVVKGVIDITNTGTRTLQQNLQAVQKKAANYERAGETMPEDTLNQVNSLKRQINDNEKYIANKQAEIRALNLQYKADLKRFRELKGIKPTNSAKM
jgi:hypothetical protein